MKRYFLVLVIILTFASLVTFAQNKVKPTIDIWYGNKQNFGQLGRAQNWINILGNVSRNVDWKQVTYSLNGDSKKSLTLGSDLHRLANKGDFNIDIGWDEVIEGKNTVLIEATPKTGKAIKKKVTFNVTLGTKWPLPYEVDFANVKDLQKVVQVVDGNWKLTEIGVKTVEPYYDRVLAVGDTNWTNFEANLLLTVNDFTPSEKGPPTYNVTHFGVALRWRGHAPDDLQPYRKWYPLGSQGEFLLKNELDSCTWRILFDGRKGAPKPKYSSRTNAIVLGKKMHIKAQVSTLPNGDTRYRFKQWMYGITEPKDWDVEGIEVGNRDFRSGALCLVPHNSDVTIHKISVIPIE